MKKISIIMPFLNEGEWPYKTIQSIYDTADSSLFEIIAINDNSKEAYDFSRFPDVKYIINEKRIGVDESRQLGAELASTDKILILDAHTLFYPNSNWLNKVIDCIERDPTTVWCFTCVGLWEGNEDIYKHQGEYYGADLKLYTEKEKDRPSRQIIEPTWSNKKPNVEEEVQVVLGANYAVSKEWFLKIHGLKNLKSWGSSEPFLSIKSWLSAGSCKINTDVKTCHLFRENSPFVTNIADLVYNKIYLLKTLFPKELEDKLMTYIPKDINLERAMKMINDNKDEIESERRYYQSIFKYSIYDLCKKFNIDIP
jgi:glycosyltransferase involved in cell wall biosynthesis